MDKDKYSKPVMKLCKSYEVLPCTYHRFRYKGLSLQEALSCKINDTCKVKKTIKELCDDADISVATYYKRLRNGKSKELALSYPAKKVNVKHDYKSTHDTDDIINQCRKAGISTTTYYNRRNKGMSHLEALTTKKRSRRKLNVKQICGNAGISIHMYYKLIKVGYSKEDIYNKNFVKIPRKKRTKKTENNSVESNSTRQTIKSKCREANISIATYYKRLKRGLSEEEALYYKKESISSLCEKNGISTATYYARRKRGLSKEESLVNHKYNKTIGDLCKEAGISTTTYYNRLNKGLSHEEALKHN